MPELPEVETIRRGLEQTLAGRRVVAVDRRPTRLRGGDGPLPFAALEGRRLEAFHRHGKHLFVALGGGATLLVHLGMTGKLLVVDGETPERPHTHLVLELDDGRMLQYVDPRRFGMLRLYGPGTTIPDTAHYGLDALDPQCDDAYLEERLRRSGAPLKSFLLDQTKLAGLGNIYVCEALWRAGLSPRRKACNTPSSRIPLLRRSIVAVLQDSLAAGGTSLNDYVDHIGRPGSFLFDVAVFQRPGQPCPRCDTAIRRLVQGGRSTFYCPGCQR